jgi:hypothetical protein
MFGSVHQPVLMAETCVEQDTVQEFGAFVQIQHVLIANIQVDAQTQQAIGVTVSDGSRVIGFPKTVSIGGRSAT